MKIHCPLCEYRPRASDRWQCRPGCYTVWNTFDTRARCPGCGKQWRETWCPACGVASLHEDWYHDERPDEVVEAREEELAGVALNGEAAQRERALPILRYRKLRDVGNVRSRGGE